jgi:hypothetical protein
MEEMDDGEESGGRKAEATGQIRITVKRIHNNLYTIFIALKYKPARCPSQCPFFSTP